MGDRPAHDEERDRFIESRHVAILRVSAAEVLKDVDAAAPGIVAACRDRGAYPLHRAAHGPSPHRFATERIFHPSNRPSPRRKSVDACAASLVPGTISNAWIAPG